MPNSVSINKLIKGGIDGGALKDHFDDDKKFYEKVRHFLRNVIAIQSKQKKPE